MSKPEAREWWIEREPHSNRAWIYEPGETRKSECVHVIEHAAYERLERELDAAISGRETAIYHYEGLYEALTQARAELQKSVEFRQREREAFEAELDELRFNLEQIDICPGCEERDKLLARNAGLVEALRDVLKATHGMNDEDMIAREALAKFGR